MKRQKTLAQNLCFPLGWSQSAKIGNPSSTAAIAARSLAGGKYHDFDPHRDQPVLAAGAKLLTPPGPSILLTAGGFGRKYSESQTGLDHPELAYFAPQAAETPGIRIRSWRQSSRMTTADVGPQ